MADPDEVAADAELEVEEEEEEEEPEEVEWLSSDSEPEHPALKQWTPSSLESEPEPEQHPSPPPATSASAGKVEEEDEVEEGEVEVGKPFRWPGWPGASVFRLVVATDKVGGLIGRRGDTIKRLCEETRARVRVLEAAAAAATNRIVLISATEESQADLPPAMDAAIKIFMHINDIEKINGDDSISGSAPDKCYARLLVPSAQATYLIGKQGVRIKSIQEITGATIKIIDKDELLSYDVVDERIVAIRGAPSKVLHALKSVLGVLRKFLVDHGVLHLFERKNQAVGEEHDNSKENQVNQVASDYRLPGNKELLLSDRQTPPSPKVSRYLLYGRDPSVCDPYLSDPSHQSNTAIQQITQTMQIPLPLAEDIIGARGQNIAFIRSVSGAVVDLEENRDYPNEVLVLIKGSSSQVQTAHQLVEEILSGNREPPPGSSDSRPDAGPKFLISGHANPANWDHLPSYRGHQPYIVRYGSSSLPRFREYRL
ncbi:RNA-binding KH domain-containing protein PEPPER-like isoform X1 [Oryza brachyantha]|uniref:RNA-binding KH domain-containing protein PEPPER-like isoform X1 n=1 Tax=Oryza brachyantha TaxID=4533 RepID=UPI000776179D|nr:RNA-binding KH domain-containing protein PEPPER-like isoform X1 [Oryza brachyantha]